MDGAAGRPLTLRAMPPLELKAMHGNARAMWHVLTNCEALDPKVFPAVDVASPEKGRLTDYYRHPGRS